MDVVSVDSLTIGTTNIDILIGSKHVEFGLVGPHHLHPLLLSLLHMLFGELYPGSFVHVRNKRPDRCFSGWYSGIQDALIDSSNGPFVFAVSADIV